MTVEGNLRQLRDLALEAVEQAERPYWMYFLEFVKSDIGPELAQWLDAPFGGYQPGSLSKRVLPWRLNTAFASVVLQMPSCTEIALQYCRATADYHARAIEDYTNLEWNALPWNLTAGAATGTVGKFAAVRYIFDQNLPDQAKVIPQASVRAWYVSNNLELVKVAAAEFCQGEGAVRRGSQADRPGRI